MKLSILTITLLLSSTVFAADNQLTKEEKAEGWQLLFDGQSISEWRNYQKPDLSSQWVVNSGVMQLTGHGGGDILTRKSFKNYDLKLDWKISQVGNSGIFILVDESGKHIYSHAPEVQILDNERHADNKIASHLSGSLYDLVASPKAAHKPAGEWNHIRIYLKDLKLQVWQNQIKTLDIIIGSERWKRLVSDSKFASWQGFGTNHSGHIGLQDHGDPVYFKNIKIKEL